MAKLSPDGRRIRTIIIATPFLVASSILLYKRLFLGEEQKRLPRTVSNLSQPVRNGAGSGNETGEWNGVPEDVRRRIQEAEQGASYEGNKRI
ncbi:hypothetical protein JCM3765_006964 [Sporobolomyces pararoseus]